MAERVSNPVFDTLYEGAVGEVLSGVHQRDEPPVDGGRWPVTILARPPIDVRRQLEDLMREALSFAGPGHFVTGRHDAVHLTIRALEPYREIAAPTDPIVAVWRAAMERAAAQTPPLRLSLTGLTLSKGGVLAQIETVDDRPWEFMDRLGLELGDEAWYEDQWMKRNIWYSTILHFAADLADPTGLVDWVTRNRRRDPVDFTIDSIELVRSRYQGAAPRDLDGDVDGDLDAERLMSPESWCTVRLTG